MVRRVILASKFKERVNAFSVGAGKPSPKWAIELAGIDPKLSDLSMARGKFRETGMDVRTHRR